MVYYFLFKYYFKKHFKPGFFHFKGFTEKTFCSTLNSWIGKLMNSWFCFFDVTNRLLNLVLQQFDIMTLNFFVFMKKNCKAHVYILAMIYNAVGSFNLHRKETVTVNWQEWALQFMRIQYPRKFSKGPHNGIKALLKLHLILQYYS